MDPITHNTKATINIIAEDKWCHSHTLGEISSKNNGLNIVKMFLQNSGLSPDIIKTISFRLFNNNNFPLCMIIETKIDNNIYNYGSFIIKANGNTCIRREANDEARCLILQPNNICINDVNVNNLNNLVFLVTIREMVDTNTIDRNQIGTPNMTGSLIDGAYTSSEPVGKIAKMTPRKKSNQKLSDVYNYIPKINGREDHVTIIPVIYTDQIKYRMKEISSLLDGIQAMNQDTNHPSCIIEGFDGIFFGADVAKINYAVAEMFTMIINVAYPEVQVNEFYTKRGINVKNYAIQDVDDYPIGGHFHDIIEEIHMELESRGKVLISCDKSYSRSTIIVLVYMMAKNGFSLRDAISILHTRPANITRPNNGFLKQLVQYEKIIKRKTSYNDNDHYFINSGYKNSKI